MARRYIRDAQGRFAEVPEVKTVNRREPNYIGNTRVASSFTNHRTYRAQGHPAEFRRKGDANVHAQEIARSVLKGDPNDQLLRGFQGNKTIYNSDPNKPTPPTAEPEHDVSPNSPLARASFDLRMAKERQRSARGPGAMQAATASEAKAKQVFRDQGIDPGKFPTSGPSLAKLKVGAYNSDKPNSGAADQTKATGLSQAQLDKQASLDRRTQSDATIAREIKRLETKEPSRFEDSSTLGKWKAVQEERAKMTPAQRQEDRINARTEIHLAANPALSRAEARKRAESDVGAAHTSKPPQAPTTDPYTQTLRDAAAANSKLGAPGTFDRAAAKRERARARRQDRFNSEANARNNPHFSEGNRDVYGNPAVNKQTPENKAKVDAANKAFRERLAREERAKNAEARNIARGLRQGEQSRERELKSEGLLSNEEIKAAARREAKRVRAAARRAKARGN